AQQDKLNKATDSYTESIKKAKVENDKLGAMTDVEAPKKEIAEQKKILKLAEDKVKVAKKNEAIEKTLLKNLKIKETELEKSNKGLKEKIKLTNFELNNQEQLLLKSEELAKEEENNHKNKKKHTLEQIDIDKELVYGVSKHAFEIRKLKKAIEQLNEVQNRGTVDNRDLESKKSDYYNKIYELENGVTTSGKDDYTEEIAKEQQLSKIRDEKIAKLSTIIKKYQKIKKEKIEIAKADKDRIYGSSTKNTKQIEDLKQQIKELNDIKNCGKINPKDVDIEINHLKKKLETLLPTFRKVWNPKDMRDYFKEAEIRSDRLGSDNMFNDIARRYRENIQLQRESRREEVETFRNRIVGNRIALERVEASRIEREEANESARESILAISREGQASQRLNEQLERLNSARREGLITQGEHLNLTRQLNNDYRNSISNTNQLVNNFVRHIRQMETMLILTYSLIKGYQSTIVRQSLKLG
ncbi:MAG: hypothetical protein U9N59_10970, partial [Campylobacterota bacterium]|nr:hypothetical protein [Campylobacterota bacterium]